MSLQEHTFYLPDLGEGLTEAQIVNWVVHEGQQVAVDEVIVEVETAKSVIEVPSPYAGTVLSLHAEAGQTVEVGKPLITIGVAGEAKPDPEHPDAQRYREEEMAGSGNVLVGYGTKEAPATSRRRRPRRAAAGLASQPVQPAPQPAQPAAQPARNRVPLVISPIVRKLARDSGVDLQTLTGTGEGGVITRSDVETAIAALSPAPQAAPVPTPSPPEPGERRIPLTGFRKAVSAALSRSRSEIPEATVWVDVDATALWELRQSARTQGSNGPGLLAYIARFVVAGLREYPVLNSRLDTEREEIVEYDHVNLGIAVQGERGLVVPAVQHAHTLTTIELDHAIRDLTERGRTGKVSPQEMESGTFTLNNYGAFQVDGSAAIINHPQVAILGIGRIIDRPWVVDGEIVARKITQMSFVFDHRVCDGATAAGFMRFVAEAIENPASAIARM